MKKIDEKTITVLTSLNIDFLGMFVMELKQNPNTSLSEFFAKWQHSNKWDQLQEYSIINQGVILTHLYGLIAYPKEVFGEEIPKLTLDSINKNEWGEFEFQSYPKTLSKYDKKILGKDVVISESDLTLEFLIRKMRNSISHARVKTYENMDFVFEDQDGTKIKFSVAGLQKFCKTFQKCYLNEEWK